MPALQPPSSVPESADGLGSRLSRFVRRLWKREKLIIRTSINAWHITEILRWEKANKKRGALLLFFMECVGGKIKNPNPSLRIADTSRLKSADAPLPCIPYCGRFGLHAPCRERADLPRRRIVCSIDDSVAVDCGQTPPGRPYGRPWPACRVCTKYPDCGIPCPN